MQCRQARLHSLVICHAIYSGAPRSPEPVAAGVVAGTWETTPGPLSGQVTGSILHQSFLTQLGDEGDRLALDRAAVVAETLLQPLGNRALFASRLDLAHHRSRGGIERIDLLRARLEQHAAEFFLAKFDVFRELHWTSAEGNYSGGNQ